MAEQSETENQGEQPSDPLLVAEDQPEVEKLPIEMTLSVGDVVYTALEGEINTESDFYIKNQKQGIGYSFYDSTETDSQPNEHIFSFNGDTVRLDLVLNAYNADNKSDKIYIYIETLK